MYDAGFEYFVIDFFSHYRNQMAMIPIMEWPVWLKEAVAHLSHIVNMDEEADRMKQQAGMK